MLHKKPCAFQDLKTHLQSCRNLKKLEWSLIKCYQTTKKKKHKKTLRFSLNRHRNLVKNLFCHSLTGIPHFRAIAIARETYMHSMFLHHYKHNTQPTYFKVQLFLSLVKCTFTLLWFHVLRYLPKHPITELKWLAIKQWATFTNSSSFKYFDFKTQSKIKPKYPNSRTLQSFHLKFFSK